MTVPDFIRMYFFGYFLTLIVVAVLDDDASFTETVGAPIVWPLVWLVCAVRLVLAGIKYAVRIFCD